MGGGRGKEDVEEEEFVVVERVFRRCTGDSSNGIGLALEVVSSE